MANGKTTFKIELETSLRQHNELKEAGAFKGKRGIEQSKKILSYIDELSRIEDVTKLSDAELTKFINDMKKMRGMLDSASRTLDSYSDAVKEQQKAFDEAKKVVDKAKTSKSTRLKEKKDALDNVKPVKNRYFYNAKTKRGISEADKIVSVLNAGDLEVHKSNNSVADQKEYSRVLKESGIEAYADATQNVENAKIQIKDAELALSIESFKLHQLMDQEPGKQSELGQKVTSVSSEIRASVDNLRAEKDTVTEEKIRNTSEQKDLKLGQIEKQTTTLGRAFKQFTLYNIALKSIKSALREAVSTVKELDKELTEQAMVTGLTRKQTYGLIESYQDLALETGATTKEIASVATEYMKQGKTIADSLVLTEAAVKAAKVARVSVGDSVNYLTTALNGFQLSAEDAMAVSDKFAALAAASATDYDELAIALSKVASQANLAGMSIDYTTALLTKGLETTREAPETMGTALKTIIARMRELSDYGETLEGDTDINNVETQLSYVDIALRNANGELRSTEDVLDELGRKWEDLDKNQQAAVAKALAGTRQQSRLIALMSDYERVIELQEISERSAGTTNAQAGVYLEGMEASLNKINVAWEKVITNLTNSEVIISAFSAFGNILDTVGDFLGTTAGSVAALTTAANIGIIILGQKAQEHKMAKLQYKMALQENIEQAKKNVAVAKENALTKQTLKHEGQILKYEELQTRYTALRQKIDSGDYTAEEQAELALLEQESTQMELMAEQSDEYILAQGELNYLLGEQNKLLGASYNWLGGINLLLGAALAIRKATTVIQAKGEKLTMKQRIQELGLLPALIGTMYAKAASQLGPIAGPIVASAILAGIVGLTGMAIAGIRAAARPSKADQAGEDVKKLSSEIYVLNEKTTAIENATNAYDKLDKKVLKTKEDVQAMNDEVAAIGEKLSTEKITDKIRRQTKYEKELLAAMGWSKGEDVQSEQEYYNSLQTNKQKIDFANKVAEINKEEVKRKRKEQQDKFEELSNTEIKEQLKDASVAAAFYNNTMINVYDSVDALNKSEELKDSLSELSNEIIGSVDSWDAYQLSQEGSQAAIEKTIKSLANLKIKLADGENGWAQEIFMNEDESLVNRTKAYKAIMESLSGTVFGKGFKAAYAGWEFFGDLEEGALNIIDTLSLTNDQINKLYGAAEDLQLAGLKIEQEQYEKVLSSVLNGLNSDMSNLTALVNEHFSEFIDTSGKTTKEIEKQWEAVALTIYDAISETIQNIGQQMDKITNQVQSFYEKMTDWDSMSYTDRTNFINENAELFKGEQGVDLLKAFESGDYQKIEEALRKNDALNILVQRQLSEINASIVAEELLIAKGAGSEARLEQLKDLRDYLQDEENLYKASLEIRLEKEKQQLDLYKDYLQEQQDALEESLEKRKEAYEKYFEAINEQQDDEDYQKEVDRITTNLSQLATGTDASSAQMRKELEQELKDLNEERLRTLRERAQEALLQSMDDQIAEISDKFDELINNNKMLLDLMKTDLKNPEQFLTNMLTTKTSDGKLTQLEATDFLGQLKTSFSSEFTTVDWDKVKIEEKGDSFVLNLDGRTIDLTESDSNVVVTAIKTALTQIGHY